MYQLGYDEVNIQFREDDEFTRSQIEQRVPDCVGFTVMEDKANYIQIKSSGDLAENLAKIEDAASKSKSLFEKTGKRTIILIEDFEKFAPKNSRIIGPLKGFMDDIPETSKLTIFATSTDPIAVDDILLRDGRFDLKMSMPPANKNTIIKVLKHFLEKFRINELQFEGIIKQIFQNESDGTFSNSQLKFIVQSKTKEEFLEKIKNLTIDIDKKALELFSEQLKYMKNI